MKKILLVLVTCLTLSISAGCFNQPRQTAFRVRSDITVGLNSNHGWAGNLNENVTVFTDEPFRIRFEVVGSDEWHIDQRFSLQFRRNDGMWTNIDAEKFPKPEKVFNFIEKEGDDEIPEDWRVIRGNNNGLKVVEDGNNKILRAHSDEEPLMVVGNYKNSWEPSRFTVVLRFPDSNQTGVGIVFGFIDPENFHQIYIDAEGIIRLSRFVDRRETTIAEEKTIIDVGHWLELEVQIEDNEVKIEFENRIVDISVNLDDNLLQSKIGLYVPANNIVEVREFELEGKTSSPPVSIVACEAYKNGAETSDLLSGSNIVFIPGAGINLDSKTIQWKGGMSQSEWEWPLVIRRFADGAVTNNEGDIFEFRMVDSNNKQFENSKNPVLTLTVPPGHIGGTFVETPGRIGPFQASNGDLYFIIEPAETDNMLMVIKSTDNGASWQEADGENRPVEGDLEGFAAELSGHTIHMIHQQTNETWYHSFRTSDHTTLPDTWEIRDHLIAKQDDPPTQVATMAVRSDGSIVAVYGGPQKLHYKIRSAEGVWDNKEIIVDQGNDLILSDPQIVLGVDDEVHFAYYGNNGTAWYRRILPDGSLTASQLLSTELQPDPEANEGSILPLVFIPETNTLSVIYQHNSGYLWEQRIKENGPPSPPVRVSDRKVINNAVDSEQAGADAIADGRMIHVFFIEDDTGSIYHTYTDEYGNWQPSVLLLNGISGSWIRGAICTRNDGVKVYGYVYDAGSGGGSGMNKYAELPLDGN